MRPRRLIASLVVSLLLGAGATVLVAWGCSVRSPLTRVRSYIGEEEPADLAALIPAQWLVRKYTNVASSIAFFVDVYEGRGVEVLHLIVDEDYPGLDKFDFDHRFYRRRAGWPFLALECSTLKHLQKPELIEHGTPVPRWLGQVREPPMRLGTPLLPLGPLWPGFAADTLLYAAAAFTLTTGVGTLSRSLRRARGLCTHCGYDRRGLADVQTPCPECGTLPGGGR